MSDNYKTALIGLGKMGVQNAKIAKIAAHYKYSTHIEAILDHPDFDCGACFDQDETIEGQQYSSIEDIAQKYCPDILVLATPPCSRLDTIKQFSNLKAIVMEKPVAYDLAQAQEIIDYCAAHNILLQINYWRRFDQSVVDLKRDLKQEIGDLQVVFMTYGNGIRNNAVHLIDQMRYLFGRISEVRSLSPPQKSDLCPIAGDVNIDFQIMLENGGQIYAHALDFDNYREVSVDIWGSKGRIEFLQGGLLMRHSFIDNHRALDNNKEIASDKATLNITSAGQALYGLYDNLAKTLKGEAQLLSDGRSALENECILDKILL